MNVTSPFVGSLLQQFANFSDTIFFAFRLRDKEILYLSPAFQQLWNSSGNSVLPNNETLFQAIHEDDKQQVTQAFTNTGKTKGTINLEFRITNLQNKEKWLKAKYYITQYNEVDVVVGIAADVTAEKEYHNTIYRYFDRKNTMLDIMAHDLTSPLNNIRMAANVLIDHNQDNKDEITLHLLETITEISRACINKIYGLFNKELLDISEEVMNKEQVDIVRHVRELVNEYQRSNNLVHQRFHFIAPSHQLFMTIDVVKIMQCIINLLSNALKFTRDNGNIWLTIEDEGEQEVLFSVKDDGIGIPAEMQPFVFDRFTKAKRPGLKGEPTVGLGLHIISNIVKLHNGSIRVESIDGNGTTFFMRIPKYS